MKERIYHIRDTLHQFFIKDTLTYREQLEVILKALPSELDNTKQDDDFGDFIYAPYGEYVAQYGCNKDDFDLSMNAIYEISKRFSCEFPIRNFILLDAKRTITILEKWSKDSNYHIRRLCSEGTRAKLPWAKKINIHYKDTENILDYLYNDTTEYVRRSVANHLHDISKIDKEYVFGKIKFWQNQQIGDIENMNYLIQHSLRTLIKNGDEVAMSFIGVSKKIKIQFIKFHLLKTKIKLNEYLDFEIEIQNQENKNIKTQVNYLIYFSGKDNKLSERKKVYKVKDLVLKPNEKIQFTKSHLFKANMSTIKLYWGEYKIMLQVNGNIIAENTFFIE